MALETPHDQAGPETKPMVMLTVTEGFLIWGRVLLKIDSIVAT